MRTAFAGWMIVLMLCVLPSSPTVAADAPHGAAAATRPQAQAADAAHVAHRPAVPAPTAWPGSMLILILGMFLAAAIVGPVVRYHASEEMPDATSHDERGHGAHDAHGHGH